MNRTWSSSSLDLDLRGCRQPPGASFWLGATKLAPVPCSCCGHVSWKKRALKMSLGQAVFVIPILKGWLVLCRFALEYCIISAEEKPVFRIWIHWFRIRIQHFKLNTDPDPDLIPPRVLMTKNWTNLQLKKNWYFFCQKLQLTYS